MGKRRHFFLPQISKMNAMQFCMNAISDVNRDIFHSHRGDSIQVAVLASSHLHSRHFHFHRLLLLNLTPPPLYWWVWVVDVVGPQNSLWVQKQTMPQPKSIQRKTQRVIKLHLFVCLLFYRERMQGRLLFNFYCLRKKMQLSLLLYGLWANAHAYNGCGWKLLMLVMEGTGRGRDPRRKHNRDGQHGPNYHRSQGNYPRHLHRCRILHRPISLKSIG